ncbi:MAG: diaminopropionate ammonia-lyase [Flavobacteriaceae bacterium]|nr:diaminopropionate ammonia-lyase [Flavobacteriaceae bacterium]
MRGSEFFINPISVLSNEQISLYKDLFDRDEAINFHRALPGYLPTPLYRLPALSQNVKVRELWVKDESERMGLKAFKVLGASYAINKMVNELPKDAILCTATDGNHGRAVAWAASLFGKKAVVFMPEATVEARINKIEQEGAEVIIVKGAYDEAVKLARKRSEENGWVLIQDTSFDGYEKVPVNIMAGYITILKEMEQQLHRHDKPALDIVFLKAGVGSWAAAAVWYYHNRYREKRPKIVLVEPSSADCCMEAMKQGYPVPTKNDQETIMAGLNCGTASKIAYNILREGVDLFISIPDWYAGAAMNAFYYAKDDDAQIISGESGAAGLGGLLAMQNEDDLREAKEYIALNNTSRVLVFNTEGNTDPVNFNRIIHGN